MNFYKMPDIFMNTKLITKNYLILLDAGHGGIVNGKYVTPGKRSTIWEDGSQYFEGVGNRILRDKVAQHLNAWGINYEYVHGGEDDLSLVKRVERINKLTKIHGPKRTLLVSIHSDAFDNPKAYGWSVYTSIGDTGLSDKAATLFYLNMAAQFKDQKFRIDMTDGDADKESNFYIIEKTNCPAVLTENFFMTNEKECKEILMTEEGQSKIAIGTALAINEYINKYL